MTTSYKLSPWTDQGVMWWLQNDYKMLGRAWCKKRFCGGGCSNQSIEPPSCLMASSMRGTAFRNASHCSTVRLTPVCFQRQEVEPISLNYEVYRWNWQVLYLHHEHDSVQLGSAVICFFSYPLIAVPFAFSLKSDPNDPWCQILPTSKPALSDK